LAETLKLINVRISPQEDRGGTAGEAGKGEGAAEEHYLELRVNRACVFCSAETFRNAGVIG
jgi:hypothetical protein